jgi:ATP-dependent DNA helicase
MGTLSLSDTDSIPTKNWGPPPATGPIKQGEGAADGFVDASLSLPVETEANGVHVGKGEEEQLLEPAKEEKADGDFFDASSSIPIDLEAKNGDASLISEVMKKEEEQLEEARLKAEEEEEARKKEEAARLALDPETRYNKLDELLTKTQLFSEFLLKNMDRIADVRKSHLRADCLYAFHSRSALLLLLMTVVLLNRKVLKLKLKSQR